MWSDVPVPPEPEIVLVTGREMPTPDPESHLLLAALDGLGVPARMRPWGPGTDWATARLVVVRSTWDYVSASSAFLGWVRDVGAGVQVVNGPDVLAWNAHKGYLTELAAAGVPTVATTVVPAGAGRDGLAAALAAHAGEVVIKPAVSAGAYRTLRAVARADVALEHLEEVTRDGDALVQPFVPSIADRGETSLLFFGGRFSHAVRKRPRAGDYRVQVHLGGANELVEPDDDEIAVAARALAAAPGPLTYARVDLVDVDGTPTLMELELIEPELFLPLAPGSALRFAEHLVTLV